MYTNIRPAVNIRGFGGYCTPPPPPPMPHFHMPAFGMLTCMPHMTPYFGCYNSFVSSFSMGYLTGSLLGSLLSTPGTYGYSAANTTYYPSFTYNSTPTYTSYTNPFLYSGTSYSSLYKPSTNYNYINLYNPVINTRSTRRSSGVTVNINDSACWRKLGYNAQSGQRLASYALSHAVGFNNSCARYVKNAIANTGLGNYEYGHAYDMIRIMRRNRNFIEISPSSVNVKNLPPGCILVYDRGVGGYSSTYGHTEITTGDGRAVSDGITRNLYKRPTAIFMPVAA